MTISEYIKNVNQRYKTGISREHSYRGDLQNLLEAMLKNVLVTNEPARIECGAPDFIITHKDVPIGYIEAKDIGEPLTGKKHKEQFSRYKESLDNLIFTDYLDFHFYREGEFVVSVRLAEIAGDSVRAVPENEEKFRQMINDFATHSLQTIKSASRLSKMMAARARLLSEIIEKALNEDESRTGSDTSLRSQLSAFQNVLMHDIDEKEFADIYAQTIAYGMFAARLHDKNLETFSRFEAARLIPKSNPFLRKLFQYIAGYDLDERIDWIVDALADIFRATDVDGLLNNFGKSTQQTDPIIHFYETFLAEFDPKLRKKRGVWYTPDPVVNFIIRAVDDILKTEFGLKDGLADTSKTTVKVKVPTHDKRHKDNMVFEEREVHKVQLLDPVAGTGTFLAEVIKQIYQKFEGQQGIWPDYVENHLIPRLNGFEILMASYAMTHLKLDLLLKETGYDRESTQRFRVYLTNSLEEHHPDTGTLFAGWLSDEANEANHIKRDTPVMVVFGNPPYSGESQNKGEWIMNLMEDYKKEPGGKEKLKERNPKWINDDYVKFMRFGQHFIEKNGEGVLAFINPHGFLDNPTFRGMRWNLLKTYDKIYTIDLHGNSKKKETAPDGSPDENVFDIQQGVSINLFVKNKNKASQTNKLGVLYHYDLFGKRKYKYNYLENESLSSIGFKKINPFKSYYLFKDIDEDLLLKYEHGIDPTSLFQINVMGFQTHRDDFAISFDKKEIIIRANDLRNQLIKEHDLQKKYAINDNRDWKLVEARKKIQNDSDWLNKVSLCNYRPFDNRYCYFSDVMMDYPRRELLDHVHEKDNIIIGIGRQGLAVGDIDWCLTTVSKRPVDANIFRRGGINLFPLYKYDDTNQVDLDGIISRKPNLDSKIVKKIATGLGLSFTPEKQDKEGTFAPIDLLDYIYAVLHSPTYRETYKEFLKIDFPRVPYPDDPEQFWKLVDLGSDLRQIHLMEHPVVNEFITTYPKAGSNTISNRLTKNDPGFIPYDKNQENHTTPGDHSYPGEKLGKIQINDEQYFGNVPLKAWEFYIGGYQPAEKWLKDRRGRTLSMEEIQHYQKIIVALMETDRLMRKIDEIEIVK
ncbi:MAG: DNA methyltransferase [Balneolaceae bacterium]|nr:DNA methyltransferase [Balneolaceae bacterium]